jgi:hypothetical protein
MVCRIREHVSETGSKSKIHTLNSNIALAQFDRKPLKIKAAFTMKSAV